MIRIVVLTAALLGGFLMPALAHDIYAEWRSPRTGLSCCNGGETGDCYPTPAEFRDGQWFALRREDQRWMPIPDNVILKDGATPDGAAHLCAPAPITEEDNRIYCFRPPWGGI